MPSSAGQTCARSEEHTSELQSHDNLVCRLLLEKKSVLDRKSTRLNSSHTIISYAVFCLKTNTHRARGREGAPTAPPPCPWAAPAHGHAEEGEASTAEDGPRARLRRVWCFFFLMIRPPPSSTLFPSTTLSG